MLWQKLKSIFPIWPQTLQQLNLMAFHPFLPKLPEVDKAFNVQSSFYGNDYRKITF